MFFPFRRGAMIGTERKLPVVRPVLILTTAFIAGNSTPNGRRPVTRCLPPAALWLLTETGSLNWEVLIDSLPRHTAKMWISVFGRGVEDCVVFTSQAASSGIGTGRP